MASRMSAYGMFALLALGATLAACNSGGSGANTPVPNTPSATPATSPIVDKATAATSKTAPVATLTSSVAAKATSATPNTATKPPAVMPASLPIENALGLVSAPNSGDACLATAQPAADVLFASAKKVFAHYFSPFPLSIDNYASTKDYYETQYLTKNGEFDKWAAEGGYLRQRPLGVSANQDTNWPLANLEHEVSLAIARGITGFTFDVMSVNQATDPNSQLHLMLQAATAVDSRFKIIVMPDITALGSNASAVVQIIASVASSPAAYILTDGRLVVSAFDGGLNSPDWWASVISRLSARNINVAFVPTFVGWPRNAKAFSSISYGLGEWGAATPAGAASEQNAPATVHSAYGKIYMMPINPQQFRPKSFLYEEAGNSEAMRNAWMSSIMGNADWVQIVTWSDFSETSEIEPYTDATLRRDIGTGFYDLTGFYAAWFATGKQPTITHDVLYYFYRREPSDAAGSAQSQLDRNVSKTAQDNIELLAFLTAPGVLEITIGGQTYTQNATAGITSFKIPTQPGTPIFTLSRDEVDVFSFAGGVEIYGHAGLPSGVIDMTYWSGSATASGVCTL